MVQYQDLQISMQPLISILIPCYNAESWVKGAIDSSLQQTYENKEVIVIDDGSTDNSWEIIRSFGSKIFAEKTLNKGAGSARNHLLQLSKGEWLQYLDADDYLLPGKIQNQIKDLDRFTSADILFSPVIIEDRWSGREKTEVLPVPEPHDPWTLLVRWTLPQTGALLWKKQAIIDAGGWKEDQPCCQEHELYLRLLKAGKEFCYSPAPGAVYRKWSSETVCERDKLETYRQRLAIISEAERFLNNTEQLTEARQNQVNQARFECARILWNFDQAWAKSLMEEIQNTQEGFVPHGRGVPSLYRYLYFCFGFTATEYLAALRRKMCS
jgi:glycosyltransferase involved in cell wall biosynthesis